MLHPKKLVGFSVFPILTWILIGLFWTTVVFSVCRLTHLQFLFTPVIIISLIIGLQLLISNKLIEPQITNFFLGIVLFLAFHFLYTLVKSYFQIPEWDFLCFFLFAKAGIAGGNFYDPVLFNDTFQQLKLQEITSNDFIREIVNVGFWYPPPTMLILLPIGWFNLELSYVIWQSLILIILMADVFLLIKIFGNTYENSSTKKISFLLISILIFIFPGLKDSIWYSQTNSILLFFLLLILRNPFGKTAGVYLCLMLLIKPLAAILALYYLIHKELKILIIAFIAGAALVLLSGLVFGYDIFLNYITSPPTERIPEFVYLESINKSLQSTLLRIQVQNPELISMFIVKLISYIVSAVLVIITILSSRRILKTNQLLSFLIFIPLTLIIYPGTLSHYIVLLVPVVIAIYKQLSKGMDHRRLLILILIIFVSGAYSLLFTCFLLLLILFAMAFYPRIISRILNLNSRG